MKLTKVGDIKNEEEEPQDNGERENRQDDNLEGRNDNEKCMKVMRKVRAH